MSLLQNNTEALGRLSGMDKAALEERFGVWAPAGRVVGALYNADTEGKKDSLTAFAENWAKNFVNQAGV